MCPPENHDTNDKTNALRLPTIANSTLPIIRLAKSPTPAASTMLPPADAGLAAVAADGAEAGGCVLAGVLRADGLPGTDARLGFD